MVSVGFVLVMVFVVAPAFGWNAWGGRSRRARFRRRIRGAWGVDLDDEDGSSGAQIAELRHELDGRLADVDSLHSRVAELENRLDFTERLLARQSQVTDTPRPVNRGTTARLNG